MNKDSKQLYWEILFYQGTERQMTVTRAKKICTKGERFIVATGLLDLVEKHVLKNRPRQFGIVEYIPYDTVYYMVQREEKQPTLNLVPGGLKNADC